MVKQLKHISSPEFKWKLVGGTSSQGCKGIFTQNPQQPL